LVLNVAEGTFVTGASLAKLLWVTSGDFVTSCINGSSLHQRISM
jgi:hypothetical protein